MNADGTEWVNGPVPVIEPERLSPILASMSDLAILVRMDGVILSILVDEAAQDRAHIAHWGGRLMQDVLTSESIPKFEEMMAELRKGGPVARHVELNHTDGADWEYPVRYAFHRVGPDDSVLMLGRDLRWEAEIQEQLVQAQIALERGYEERRVQDARYRVVLAGTAEPFVFLSANNGRIRDLNTTAATFFGKSRDDLIGMRLSQLAHAKGDDELGEMLAATAASGGGEMVICRTQKGDHEFMIAPTVYRASGERMLYCRLILSEETNPHTERLSQDLRALFHRGPEAIVFCSVDGVIHQVNEAFLDLVELPSLSNAIDRNLGDFLHRGQIDLGVILKHVRNSGRLASYSTRLTNDLGDASGVHLSATLLGSSDRQTVGFVFRDAERGHAVGQGIRAANISEAPNQSVVDLVGSATLKEIVAEANEVIEKICIEAAVDLTKNNRAAAAEMLGVSRQSLYVKLKKYGLQERSGGD